MISGVFIDRPRLAIVISIVITLAGLIALDAIPIAQFPDIVPPQVQVTATYPGAGAEVVEATVAQPIESQVIGVDNMLYMKSTSGNDGSYTLTVTFAIGTNPDINTVNVQNRVSSRHAQAAPGGAAARASASRRSHRRCCRSINLYSPNEQLRHALPHQLRDHQHPRQPEARARASATRSCSAPSTTACASGSTPTG